jgi:ABC-type transport system involved in multi-copper enzyme maturation permease subunit
VTRLVRIELLKLRSTRLSYGLLATGAGLSAAFAVLSAFRAGSKAMAPLDTASGLAAVITATGFALLMAAVLGITVSSGEFRHHTATATYLATPDRTRVLAAKVVAAALAGAVCGLVASAATTGTGLAFVAARGYEVALGGGTMTRYAAGAAGGAALMAAAGAGLGSLIRSQLAAVIGVFAWAAVAEAVIGSLLPSVRPYLPYTAATTLAGTRLGGASFGAGLHVTGPGPLPFAAAAALVAGVAVLLAAAASRTTVPADIT